MESIFFAKLFGLYFIIIGILVLVRRQSIMPAINDLVKSRGLMVAFGFLEIVAGLALVIARPDITFDWEGIVSLVGWMLLIEGIVYLSLPAKTVQKMVAWFNTPAWYIGGGIASVLIGIYLAGIGFAIF